MEATSPKRLSPVLRVSFLALSAVGLGLAIFALFPGARPWILEEDRLIENLSALTFFLAGLWAAILLVRGRGQDAWVLYLVAFLGFLGCADELSFGERLFELEMPTLRGLKIDGAHDFAELGAKALRDLWRAQPVIILSVAGCLLVIAEITRRRSQDRLLDFARSTWVSPSRLSLALAVAWVGIATLIDLPLSFFDSDWIRATEELLELNAGILLWAAAHFNQAEPADPRRGPPKGTVTGG